MFKNLGLGKNLSEISVHLMGQIDRGLGLPEVLCVFFNLF